MLISDLRGLTTLLALLGAGSMAGLFFAFSTSVMPALRRRPASEAAATMQEINRVILNPLFLGVFLGTALASVLAATFAAFSWNQQGDAALVVGALSYLLGTFLVTVVYHVPRNDRLAGLDPSSAPGQEYWTTYVREWTRMNHVRGFAALLSATAFAVAL